MIAAPAPGQARLAKLAGPMLGLLVVEFLLGMALALFVTLPSGSALSILVASPLLWVHIVVGFLLIGITANALRWAFAGPSVAMRAVAAMGLVSAIGAFVAGMAFAFGDQSPTASFAMSVGFVGVLVEAGYLLSRRPSLAALSVGQETAPTPSEG